MPLFIIEANTQHKDTDTQNILKKSSVFISEMLGKPEKYVMASIDTNKQMMFGGTSQPTAFVTLKSIGLPIDKCSEFSSKICQFITDQFNIRPDRVFIDFEDLQRNMFGWNGKTF